MRRCRNCLCSKCMNTCFKNVSVCENYKPFEQMRLFEQKNDEWKKAPRKSWNYYGITKQRYRQLKEYIQSGKYASVALQAAHTANKNISMYILMSVMENLSYDGLQMLWDLKKIERMAYGRSDFYGYRRLFFANFDKKMRRIGK